MPEHGQKGIDVLEDRLRAAQPGPDLSRGQTGSFGLFFTAFLIFLRLFPVISVNEVKGVLGYAKSH